MFDLQKGQRVALTATLITIVLALAKGIIGKIADSSALIADAVHSGTDILAIFASWLGLTLAKKKPGDKFPYGLYKAETLAALFVSGIIIYLSIILFLEGREKYYVVPQIEMPLFAFGIVGISAVVSLILYYWENRIGHELNSQSLIANSDECKADFVASVLVFFAVLCSHYKIMYVESLLTIVLSIFLF
jgi:cation diffusion facilitator family transporter